MSTLNCICGRENILNPFFSTYCRVAGEPYDPQAPEEPDLTLSRHPARSGRKPLFTGAG